MQFFFIYLRIMKKVSQVQCFKPYFTLTFMHLADASIQSDLQCIQAIHLYCQYMCSLGI